jgi:hypothetical protein
MSALDIAARGLAKRALAQNDAADEGVVSLDARESASAQGTEALMDSAGAVSGRAGAVHEIENIPYPKRVAIRGNGAELRNTNPADLSVDHLATAALALGFSNAYDTPSFTYFSVLAENGPELTLEAGAGASFAPGDFVVLHGSIEYTGFDYQIFRNYLRARVAKVSGDTVTLDRGLPDELLADDPVIANVTTAETDQGSYLLYRPHVSHLTLSSENGYAWFWGGAIDGTFRDIHLDGRNGISFNAMQDCLFENIHFQSWRKIAELAEGSVGTTVRTMRGTLTDASTKFGGQSDVPGSFISMNENCAECVYEDFNVSSGPNSAANGCQMRAGRNNVVRNSILRFPAHTGNGLLLVSHAEAGNPNQDCGFENLQVFLPVCSTFFRADDLGAGVIRPSFRNIKFFGSVSNRAGQITGDQGVLENVWCEDGGLLFAGPCTNWRIENCYFPDGFANLTQELLNTNALRGNESDASRRIAAAAIVERTQTTIDSTVANNLVHTMTIAPGDLKPLDEVHFCLAGSTSGGGTNARHVRVTARIDGTTDTEIAHLTMPANFASWALEGVIDVHTDNIIHCSAKQIADSGTTSVDTRTTGGNLDLHGLTLKVELWTDGGGNVVTRLVKIAGQKAGMRNVPVFG